MIGKNNTTKRRKWEFNTCRRLRPFLGQILDLPVLVVDVLRGSGDRGSFLEGNALL